MEKSLSKCTVGLRYLAVVACLSVSVSGCVTPLPAGEVTGIAVSEIQAGTSELGQPVRWGGTVVNVQNKQDITVIEVVSRPLLASGRPARNDKTQGRFLAEVSGFLDPEILVEGRDITLTGVVKQLQDGTVGEANYSYPVLSVFKYHFWQQLTEKTANWGYPLRPWLDHPGSKSYGRYWPYHHRSSLVITGGILF